MKIVGDHGQFTQRSTGGDDAEEAVGGREYRQAVQRVIPEFLVRGERFKGRDKEIGFVDGEIPELPP